MGKQAKELSPEALALLLQYDWPGNVREVQNVIERAVLISDETMILPEHLPESIRRTESVFEEAIAKGLSIEEYTSSFVRKYQNIYSEQEIANMLGITRKTLWEKRKKWGLKKASLQPVTEKRK